MIAQEIYDESRIVAPTVTDAVRATALFNAVLASVELNPAKFDKFISILQQIQGSHDLVAFIKGKSLYSLYTNTSVFSTTTTANRGNSIYMYKQVRSLMSYDPLIGLLSSNSPTVFDVFALSSSRTCTVCILRTPDVCLEPSATVELPM